MSDWLTRRNLGTTTPHRDFVLASKHDAFDADQRVFFIPAIVSGISLAFLAWRVARASFKPSKSGQDLMEDGDEDRQGSTDAQSSPTQLDGIAILVYKVLRLGGVMALLVLGIHQAVLRGSVSEWVIVATLMYTSVLVFLALAAKPNIRGTASRHATLILFTTFAVFFGAYVWPFMTISQPNRHDPKPTSVTWATIALLGLTGVLGPFFVPGTRKQRFPGEVVRPEDLASTFSRLTFAYYDKLVFHAYRFPDTKVNDLPQLAHIDRSSTLRKTAVLKLDPLHSKKRTHIFWVLTRYFAADFALLVLWMSINGLTQFLAPIALRYLLSELEGASASAYKPWVWILLITTGPIASAICSNQFFYVLTRMGIQEEGILTQMIFDHALRLRLGTHKLKKSPMVPGTPKTTRVQQTSGVTTIEGAAEPGLDSAFVSSNKLTGGEASDEEDKDDHIVGKVNNLMASDITTITEAPLFILVGSALLQLAVAILFLYQLLGWSTFVGLGVIVICIPVPSYTAKLAISAQETKMKMSDKRVEAVTENVSILRMIKLFAWDPKILKSLDEHREDELKYIRRGKLLNVIIWTSDLLVPIMSYMATAATYTVVMKKSYTPSIAFSSLAIFDIVRSQLSMTGHFIPGALRAKVSYSRLNDFLHMGELLPEKPDRFAGVEAEFASEVRPNAIEFNAVSFSWHKEEELAGSMAPSQRSFRLRCDGPVEFKGGGLNIVVGPTGSGKTSLLMALLGEMHYNPSGPTSWVSLPREGNIAYAAQESWVLNETIKNNILFGQPYDEARYKMVFKQCALERDLEIWEAGDETEVGEKGLTLSGGQKARVTLARALYSPAQILLLDDVLAALDVHTAKGIVNQVFQGSLVKGRTVILVTHNLSLVAPICDYVVVIAKDGQIIEQGTPSEVLTIDAALRNEVAEDQAEVKKAEEVMAEAIDEKEQKAGKLIVAEEKALGRISMKAIMLYVHGVGGLFTWAVIIFCLTGAMAMSIAETSFIGYWSSQYEGRPPSEVKPLWFLEMYALIDAIQVGLKMCVDISIAIFSVRASRAIHTKLMNNVFGAPLRWLDTVPVGRITTRCTQDMQTIDSEFSDHFFLLLQITTSLILYYCTTVFMTGWIAFVSGAIVATLGGWLGNVYLQSQLAVKRDQSNAKAPVMSQVAVGLQGLVSIRAYGAQSAFQTELRKRLDNLMRCETSFFTLNRWIGVRTDTLGGLFAGAVTLYMVYMQNLGAAAVGFTLSVIVAFSRNIIYWIRILNEVEVLANSLERILDFINVEQEPKPVETMKPPAYWPASGNLRVEGLSARYSDDFPEVLKDLRFEAKSGERIGIVGRTGAGKSSVALALLRAIKTTGKVYLDDRAIDTVNLDALRSNITLIPQHPELLPGTVRENLDPFEQYEDAALNDALRSAGLFDLQETREDDQAQAAGPSSDGFPAITQSDRESHKITLESEVKGAGMNFSVGQRQILALARAILRRSKLLILDEATAAIDYETDAAIQKFLRTELSKDVTVITIAHRLQTVMDSDKIMVLDSGKLVEYDSPRNLLRRGGFFRSLVEESSDRDHLVKIANA